MSSSGGGASVIDTANKPNGDEKSSLRIRRIFAGGDHCFAFVTEDSKNVAPEDFRLWNQQSQIWSITLDLAKTCAQVDPNHAVDLDLLSTLEIVFKSLPCFNASFLLENNQHYCSSSKNHGVDMQLAETSFDFIRKIEHENLKQLVRNLLEKFSFLASLLIYFSFFRSGNP